MLIPSPSFCLRRGILALSAICAAFSLAAVEIIDQGHVDLVFDFDPDHETWQVGIKHDDMPFISPDEAYFYLNNYPVSGDAPTGNYVPTRPSGAQWDFIGVNAGEPFWFVSARGPGPGQISVDLGMNSEGTPPTTFLAWSDPDDPRSEPAERWMTISLEAVRYEGEGVGHVSLWTGTADEIYWSTAVEPAAGNKYYLNTGGHQHMNWGFSDQGIYELDLRAAGRRMGESGEYVEESEIYTFYFAVGELPPSGQSYADWAQTRFSEAEIAAGLAQADVDPFGRGVLNLIAYALGIDPQEATPADLPTIHADPSTGTVILRLNRYLAARAITLSVQRSLDLIEWQEQPIAQSVDGAAFEALVPGVTVSEVENPGGETAAVDISLAIDPAQPFFLRLLVSGD